MEGDGRTHDPAADRDRRWDWEQILRAPAHGQRWLHPYEELPPFVRLLEARGARRVHDLGCGAGRHLVFLARAGFDASGSDASPSALATAREWLAREGLSAAVWQADMAADALPREAFDAIVCVHAIFHQDAAGIERTLANARQALRPGGLLFVTFNSTESDSFRSGDHPRLDERTVLKSEPGGIGTMPHHYVDRAALEAYLRDFRLLRTVHREERDHADGFRTHARWAAWAEKPERRG